MTDASRELVVDSCCLLNLLASGCEVDIAAALGVQLVVAEAVAHETRFLWTPPDADGDRFKEPADLEPLRASGWLTRTSIDGEAAIDAFVAAAERLSDPDAQSVAIAATREAPLASDDRKVRRVALELFPKLALRTTLSLFFEAVEAIGWTEDEAARVAANLFWRGNFAPPRWDPDSSRYASLLERSGIRRA